MLMSVKEYAAKNGISVSTVQRRLNKGDLKGKRLGRVWYVTSKVMSEATEKSDLSQQYQMDSVVGKLMECVAKLEQLQQDRQRLAELQAYVAMLEKQLFSDRRGGERHVQP